MICYAIKKIKESSHGNDFLIGGPLTIFAWFNSAYFFMDRVFAEITLKDRKLIDCEIVKVKIEEVEE
jgi:hypothetical protein